MLSHAMVEIGGDSRVELTVSLADVHVPHDRAHPGRDDGSAGRTRTSNLVVNLPQADSAD